MIGIDTNVLIRYIVQDDPRQAGAATRFVERACTAESPGFVGLIVLCECVWVLTSAYGYLRSDVSKVLAQILRVAQFRVENPQAVWRAESAARAVRAAEVRPARARLAAARSIAGDRSTIAT